MENEDLCVQCVHYWEDFLPSLDITVAHCSILDENSTELDLDDFVEYPCLICPFNSFVEIEY